MDPLDDLYQEVILDHAANPRHRGRLPTLTHHATGHNPVCGDTVTIDLAIAGDRIEGVAFAGEGCSISQAAASMLSAAVAGQPVAAAEALAMDVRRFMQGEAPRGELGDLEALSGVRRFPVRVKCATLAANTLLEALGAPLHL